MRRNENTPEEINVLALKLSADDGNWEYDGDNNNWKNDDYDNHGRIKYKGL